MNLSNDAEVRFEQAVEFWARQLLGEEEINNINPERMDGDDWDAIMQEVMSAERQQQQQAAPDTKKPLTKKRQRVSVAASSQAPAANPAAAVAPPTPQASIPKVVPGSELKFRETFMYYIFRVLYNNVEPGAIDPLTDDENIMRDKQLHASLKESAEQFLQYWTVHRIPEVRAKLDKTLPRHRPIHSVHEHYIAQFFCMHWQTISSVNNNAANAWSGEHVAHNNAVQVSVVPYLKPGDKSGRLESSLPPPIVFYLNDVQATYLRCAHVVYFLQPYIATAAYQLGQEFEQEYTPHATSWTDLHNYIESSILDRFEPYQALRKIIEEFKF